MQKSGLASSPYFTMTSRRKKRRTFVGYSHRFSFNFAINPCPIILFFPHFIRRPVSTRSPSNDELVCCLKDLLNTPGQAPVYLIVDALDECPNTSLPSDRDQVLTFLEDLVDSWFPNLRICVTSRPETDIKPILEPLTFRSVSLHDESGQKEDIENYIKSIVNTDRRMRRWIPAHKQLVIDVLTERADGM